MNFDEKDVSMSAQVWILKTGPLHNHVSIRIHWLRALPPDCGTKYQRERLVRSMKGLMQALIRQGGEGGALAAATVNNAYGALRRIVAWMTARGIWSFRDLQPRDILNYIAHRQTGRKKPLSEPTVHAILTLFRKLWQLRDEYLMPLRFDPLVVESELKLTVETRSLEPWRHLDEQEALPLVKDALEWIQLNGDIAIGLVRRMWAERRTHVGLRKGEQIARVRSLYLKFGEEPDIRRIARSLRMEDSPPDSVIARIMTVTEGACVVALLFLVGMRASELTRLDADCVEFVGSEGLGGRTVLKGFAAKRQGMARTWAASEHVVEVVQFLGKLYDEIRAYSGQRALLLNKAQASPIPLPNRKIGRLGSESLAPRLHAFANSPHRGKRPPLRLHAHMARKTFARFVVMRDKSALESLAYHYGHVHSAITDGSYVGTDMALASLLREEDRADLAEALMDLLSSGALGGRAGKSMMASIEGATPSTAAFRGRRSLRSVVDKLIKSGIHLAPCDWGYCVYSRAMSACGGDESGPNIVRRAPDVCATCSNFSVTDRHRPYWNERLRRDEEFLKRSDLPEQTRQVVNLRMDHSREVLVSLTAVRATADRAGSK